MAVLSSTKVDQHTKEKKQELIHIVEEMEFLKMRQQFKEDIRKKLRKELGSSAVSSTGCSPEKRNLSYDNFGSFFGPSKASIARRVIEETAPEIKKLASKAKNPVQNNIKSSVHSLDKKELLEALRYTRDYSFLDSPDSELPKFPSKPSQGKTSKIGSSIPEQKNTQNQNEPVPKDPNLVSSNSKNHPQTNTNKNHEAPNGQKALVSKLLYGAKRKTEQEQDLCKRKKAKLASEKLQPSKHQVPPGCAKVPTELSLKKEQMKKVREPNKEEKIEQARKVLQEKNKENKKQTQPKSSLKQKIRQPTRGIFDDDDNMESEFDSILQMLSRHNGKRPVTHDDYGDDLDCMVSSFGEIEKEERKSAKIARKKDQIERLRIEEEERKENLRRQAKKQKQPVN